MLLAADVSILGNFSTDKHGAVFALAGWSGSGKTTLVEQLVAHLVGLGYDIATVCLLYTSPSPRDGLLSRMPSSA